MEPPKIHFVLRATRTPIDGTSLFGQGMYTSICNVAQIGSRVLSRRYVRISSVAGIWS